MLNDNVKYAMASSRSVDFSTESPINSSSAPTNYHISVLFCYSYHYFWFYYNTVISTAKPQ